MDTQIVADISKTVFQTTSKSAIVLATGGPDLRPGLVQALEEGWAIEFYSWKTSLSRELHQWAIDSEKW